MTRARSRWSWELTPDPSLGVCPAYPSSGSSSRNPQNGPRKKEFRKLKEGPATAPTPTTSCDGCPGERLPPSTSGTGEQKTGPSSPSRRHPQSSLLHPIPGGLGDTLTWWVGRSLGGGTRFLCVIHSRVPFLSLMPLGLGKPPPPNTHTHTLSCLWRNSSSATKPVCSEGSGYLALRTPSECSFRETDPGPCPYSHGKLPRPLEPSAWITVLPPSLPSSLTLTHTRSHAHRCTHRAGPGLALPGPSP